MRCSGNVIRARTKAEKKRLIDETLEVATKSDTSYTPITRSRRSLGERILEMSSEELNLDSHDLLETPSGSESSSNSSCAHQSGEENQKPAAYGWRNDISEPKKISPQQKQLKINQPGARKNLKNKTHYNRTKDVILLITGFVLGYLVCLMQDRSGFALVQCVGPDMVDVRHERCLLRSENPLPAVQYLKQHFSGQNADLWTSVEVGVKELGRNEKPLIILFVYKSGNYNIANCLANKITKAVFPGAVSEMSTDFSQSEYGLLLKRLRSYMLGFGGFVLENLQDLPGHLSQALHVICDRENPIVSKSMVTMTLMADAKELSQLQGAKLSSWVYKELEERWAGHVDSDKLPALLTRLVSRVVKIEEEDYLPQICYD